MRTKHNYLKYISVLLVVVFLTAGALILLEVWEKNEGRYSVSGAEDGVITYKGKEYKYKEALETFLVLGLDRYSDADFSESHDDGVQADFLMLFLFNNETKQSTAIHINRDAMTKVNRLSVGGTAVVDTYVRQIALAYSYANVDNDKIRCRNVKDSVEYLFPGVKVDHFLSLTMDAVPASCDLVGGVEVTVLDDFTGIDESLIRGEKVTLIGEQALRYVRSRQGLEDSTNRARMARQQQYINALYDKIDSCIAADDEFLVRLVDTMDDYVVYDSSDHKMLKFAEKFDDYEFLGIQELEGETKLGEEFVEFYPDEEFVRDLVVELFYAPQTSEKE